MPEETIIRDPIHGDIALEPYEVELVDTQDFQRLRELKQLGMAQLIYPSAVHTCFEHALGTLYVAEQIVKKVESRRKREIDSGLRSIIRMVALLNDIAHLPFGNALEMDYGLEESSTHGQQARLDEFLGSGTEIGKLLDRLGYANQIRAAILSTPRSDTTVVKPFVHDVIVGPGISASFLDSSVRDASQVGIAFAYSQRILNFFDVDPHTGHLFLHAADKERLRLDVLSEVAGLLTNQYHMTEVVHWHRTKRAAEAMLARVFQASGLSEKDILHFGDYKLIESLQQSECREARVIMPLLRRRHLYKTVFEVSGIQAEFEWQRDKIVQMLRRKTSKRPGFEQVLESAFNLPPGAVAISCPLTGVSTLGQTLILTSEQITPQRLEELADIPTAWEFRVLLERLKSLWSVLVFLHPDYLSVAREIAHLFENNLNSQGLDITNELETRLAMRITEEYPALPVGLRRKKSRSDKGRGRPPQRISDLDDALDFALRLKDEKAEATAHYELGVACSELGKFAEAVAHFQRALELVQTMGDKEAVASFSRELGVIYMGMGRFQDAVEMFHRSLEITQQFGDERAEARALDNLGLAYANFGDYKKAITYLQQVLDMWRGLNDRTEMMNTLRRLGKIYMELHDYNAALSAYELCLAATGPSEPSEYIPIITEMSRLYAEQRDFAAAETLLRQAIQRVSPSKRKKWATELYGQLGFVLFSQSKKEEALTFLERAQKG